MNWRRAAVITLGVLLPLPLVAIILMSAQFWGDASALSGRPISPLLPRDDLRKLLSFQRPCQTSEDCDPSLACLNIDGGGTWRCVASECLNDAQCTDGFICRVLNSHGNGPLVRFCVPKGTVPEGTLCVEAPANRDGACLPGLICAGWCGRPCQMDDPSTCPSGSFCADSLNGPSCLPSCTEDSCSSGQHCIRFTDGISACAEVAGVNCQESPCPAGRKCTFTYSPGRNRVEMECVTPCDEQAPSCPVGEFCSWGACRRRCDHEGSAICEPGEQCVELPVEKISLCRSRYD
jgi:hypothetical protein